MKTKVYAIKLRNVDYTVNPYVVFVRKADAQKELDNLKSEWSQFSGIAQWYIEEQVRDLTLFGLFMTYILRYHGAIPNNYDVDIPKHAI